ncbi:MAG: siroheme synthase [Proteobacteria bacterium]|nr:siroheme synthase [Pseudomonadota bacterium]
MPNVNERSVPNPSASRIGPLANLPVFFKLDGKRVVLVGGGEPALWKAELLSATGALVEVFAETFVSGFYELSAAPPNGQILLVDRKWTVRDLAYAALAVGSFGDDAEAAAFASAARDAGVPVNVVDRPAFCDFQFGAIVNRSPLVVGISTDGAAPVFGQAIRSLIESLLPDGFRRWARAAGDLRQRPGDLGDTADKKRRFWQRFTDLALRAPDMAPTEADLAQLLDAPTADVRASVSILDICKEADALTLGAVRLLRTADDIFFDEDVPSEVRDFMRREARRHPISPGDAGSQAAVDALASAAASGARVVRLRLRTEQDDRGAVAEVDALRAAGLSVMIVSRTREP